MAGLEDLLGGLLGGGQGGAAGVDMAQLQSMAGPLMEQLGSGGGLEGLLGQLQSGGLESEVGSWVGTGANAPVSPEQITSALGTEQVDAMASQAGVSPDQLSSGLSAMLPGLVDQLSPNGELPGGDQLMGLLGGLLGGPK